MIHHQRGPKARFSVGLSTALLAILGAAQAIHAVDACAQTDKPTGGSKYTTDGVGNEAKDGNHELWHDGGGSMTMTVYGKGAAFKADWNSAGDFLARVGYRWGSNGSGASTYAPIIADYNFTKTGNGGGYSYIGIYGWARNPLVEYYVVENGFWTSPPNGGSIGGTSKNSTLTIDGGIYDIYTSPRNQKPSIDGTKDFTQYWSIRRTPRTCGRISLSAHFAKWASLSMPLGNLVEAKLLVEAGGGAGTFDLTYGTMQINATDTSTKTSITPRTEPQFSRANGAFWNNGKSGVVSLISMKGTVVSTMRQEASAPAIVPTANLPKGMYIVRFQGEGMVPETGKILVD